MEEFQYVILGDEPAGLWLARRLWEEGKDVNPPPRIAVIHWTDLPRPTLFPAKLTSSFQIKAPEKRWSAEVVTPRQNFLWNDATLAKKFPELPPTLLTGDSPPTDIRPNHAQWNAIRRTIKTHPEILGFSAGLWKAMGRSHKLHPETLVFGTLLCTEIFDWEPLAELPEAVQRFSLLAENNVLEEAKPLRGGNLCLQFQGQPPISAGQVFLNVSFRRLALLSGGCRDLWNLIHTDGSLRAHEASYPCRLRVENHGLPWTLQPLTIAFDTDEIPEIHSEIWSVQHRALSDERELTLWADSARELSLEAVLHSFRQGMQRLNRLFPFLSRSLIQVSTPLSMESCFEESQRRNAMTLLDSNAREWYDLTSFHTQTKHPALQTLFPFLRCQLPYPVGPLLEAQRLLEGIKNGFDKQKRAQDRAKRRAEAKAEKAARSAKAAASVPIARLGLRT